MKDNIQLAREKTRNSVADITGWCLVVALRKARGQSAVNVLSNTARRAAAESIRLADFAPMLHMRGMNL